MVGAPWVTLMASMVSAWESFGAQFHCPLPFQALSLKKGRKGPSLKSVTCP